MANLHESAATLRFFGDDLDPDELTRRLGAAPTTGVRKGDHWFTSRGVRNVAPTGSWRLGAERRAPADLDAQISELLAPLTSDLDVWRDLTGRFRADIFCGLFMAEGNEGIDLSPASLAAAGSRGLLIDLDLYGPLHGPGPLSTSAAVIAAQSFLATVWDNPEPSRAALVAALDQLIAAFHATPDSAPAEQDLDPPEEDLPALYERVAARFPQWGYYPVADPLASVEQQLRMGDALDDLADITRDMREVIWRAEHLGDEDAQWCFRLHHFHWADHARRLAMYLTALTPG